MEPTAWRQLVFSVPYCYHSSYLTLSSARYLIKAGVSSASVSPTLIPLYSTFLDERRGAAYKVTGGKKRVLKRFDEDRPGVGKSMPYFTVKSSFFLPFLYGLTV